MPSPPKDFAPGLFQRDQSGIALLPTATPLPARDGQEMFFDSGQIFLYFLIPGCYKGGSLMQFSAKQDVPGFAVCEQS
jgi:hypothetical protein